MENSEYSFYKEGYEEGALKARNNEVYSPHRLNNEYDPTMGEDAQHNYEQGYYNGYYDTQAQCQRNMLVELAEYRRLRNQEIGHEI